MTTRKSDNHASDASPSPGSGQSPKEPESRKPFGAVSIVGLGLIGGSLALAFRQSGYRGRIIAVSRSSTIEEARRLGVVDEGFVYEELPEALSRSDLVLLAGPISVIVKQLELLGKHASSLLPGTVITDVGSTKRAILDAARKSLPDHVSFVGGHPLAGSELRGLGAADPFLFQNAYYVLTPPTGTQTSEVQRLADFLLCTGARIVILSAEDHDRIAATISHLPQILAVSLVRSLDGLGSSRDDGKRLAAGGFRDMTRIASSPYSVWRDIIATNRDMIREVASRFLEETHSSVELLEDHTLEAEFESAARTRSEIPRDTKGFFHHIWDVLVLVEDRPGIIAGIAVPLAERGININDIEVLKVREGEGGTLRLGFDSQDHAREAIELLEKMGYRARLPE